jgi:lipopolysaccharide/colanic/teichoic acid biosynthesis glycosyltransferase
MFRSQYEQILCDRPGITDPATLEFRHEEQALRAGNVEGQYIEEILPRKLKLSMAYGRRRTLLTDLGILYRTLLKIPPGPEDAKKNAQAHAQAK